MDPHNSGNRGNEPEYGSGYGDAGYGASGYGASGYGAAGYGAQGPGPVRGQHGYDYAEGDYSNADYADGDYDGYDPGEGYGDAGGGGGSRAGGPPKKPRRSKRGPLRRRKKLIAAIGALILLGGGALVAWGYAASLPTPETLKLPERTTLYYADGTTVMAALGRQNRTIVPVTAMPDHVKSAVIAAEDLNFRSGSRTNISRQYVRLAADLQSRSTMSNIRVALIAGKVEDKYSKDDILGFYLNAVYFGRGAYGIEAAAQAYFGKPLAQVTAAEAIVLAAVIRSPEDGRYDPTVNQAAAQARFGEIRDGLVKLGSVPDAGSLALPTTVVKYDATASAGTGGLDKPTGLVVRHVLSELRQRPEFAGKPAGFIENGGFKIVTTVDPKAQALLEKNADETVKDSAMFGQPATLQAAAAVVEPGTGRVVAYYGGHSGTGSDFAGWYYDDDNSPTGYGAHQPGGTFEIYALAAALKDGVSLKSYWDARSPQEFPNSGRTGKTALRNTSTAKCQPACTLLDSTVGGLDTPFFGLTESLSATAVLDMARSAGIDDIWAFVNANDKERLDIRAPADLSAVVPSKIANEVGIGQYPVTVLDQANAMATFGGGGVRGQAHFVREVRDHSQRVVYSEKLPAPDAPRVLSQASLDDLNFALSQTPSGKLSGRSSSSKTGIWLSGTSTTDTAHAWIVGYTPSLAMAVWVGNKAEEKPLRTTSGAKVTGSGLPATIFRGFMNAAHTDLKFKKVTFPPPRYVGDDGRGNTPGPG